MALFSRTPKKDTVENASTPQAASTGGNSNGTPSSAISFFSRLTGSTSRAVPGQIRARNTSFGSVDSSSSSAAQSTGTTTTDTSQGTSSAKTLESTNTQDGKSYAGGGGGQGRNSKISGSEHNSTSTASSAAGAADKGAISSYRVTQFERVLEAENVNDSELRTLAWRGVPPAMRTQAWQLMCGYVPLNKSRRATTIAKKRKEYTDAIPIYFDTRDSADKTPQELEALRQIQVDLPRTCPDLLFFHSKPVQRMMERILYIWSIRHPASGYVQGMNDVLTPLLIVSTQPYMPAPASGVERTSVEVLRFDIEVLSAKTLMHIEADAYWKFSKLLDGVQDHYTFSQPGLQRMVLRLEDLMRRTCPALNDHFIEEGVLYMQFAFRWMNCFLLRELPLQCILRLWDTYFAEERAGFESFHVNVCAVLLKTFESKLMEMPFQDMVLFLQDIPTKDWGEQEMDEMVSQAFVLSTLYDSSHLP